MTGRIGWVDATGGVSGDMLLGACLGAGVGLAAVQQAIDTLGLPEAVRITEEPVWRGGVGATRAVVDVAGSTERRTLGDILALLEGLDSNLRTSAAAVFRVLAEAEARVHRVPVEEVHFHEVGALDSIVDVVGVVAALDILGLDRLVCSPVALGGGRVRTEHGPLPVPGPAVLELLRDHGAPGFGGPTATELATPTGVALMVVLADEFGSMPLISPDQVGIGAGAHDPDDHCNVTRLVVGEASGGLASGADVEIEQADVLEANVDDLDPRLWPQVLSELLAAGASDAWLTPIVMKKGRPAHTVSVLAKPGRTAQLERVLFSQTTTIGLRRHHVDKHVLPREQIAVEVYGEQIGVKVARLDGRIVNVSPEYDDVARVASKCGIPVKLVMTAAQVAAARSAP